MPGAANLVTCWRRSDAGRDRPTDLTLLTALKGQNADMIQSLLLPEVDTPVLLLDLDQAERVFVPSFLEAA